MSDSRRPGTAIVGLSCPGAAIVTRRGRCRRCRVAIDPIELCCWCWLGVWLFRQQTVTRAGFPTRWLDGIDSTVTCGWRHVYYISWVAVESLPPHCFVVLVSTVVLLVLDLLLCNIAYLFDTYRSRLNVNSITLVLISFSVVHFMHRRESQWLCCKG